MNRKLALYGLLGAAVIAAPSSFVFAQTPAVAPPSGPALARIEERLNQFDQQMRALTDKIEQQQYAVSQMQQAQTNALADMQRRMQDLDVRVNTVGAISSSAPAAPVPPTPAPVENKAAALEAPGAPAVMTPSTSATPTTATGTTPTQDPNAPLASAPTVQALGAVSDSGAAQPGTPEALYESAFTLVKDQKYPEAEAALKGFLKDNPNHALAGNAQYWLGETYYARKQYKEAAKAFALGYQKYRRAPKAADNLLKLALSLEALGNKNDACVTLQQFKTEYQDAAASLKAKADAEITKLECAAAAE